ncbi:ABC-type transport system, substrate-binding protein [Altererythrobacter xiamenensis]|uniref:ABC-type transport system, substrate-binding protein n=1 Tax=Altererythrobacter xiamenensis TaxID=1316679 RepID=A0A1Y6F3E4_9SPHN|nr:ABC transporter substrate-binding protein [Altererythrobacter xiamenensis]SMQ69287.1 ABC-type transport system, substrate-binding protein [Altererythrobacter xiamenensis]
MIRICYALFLSLLLAACGSQSADGPVEVAVIGQSESLFQQGVRLSAPAQHLRASTHEGLVAMNASGQIVPAIAERWIVTDDGMSYIFRLRNTNWPSGDAITATDVRRELLDNLRRLEGTSLGLDLAKIRDVRAMTGRVVEIRLTSPMPEFLRLLAQPEMGLIKEGQGAGPMQLSRDEERDEAILTALPPEQRGMPARRDWEELTRPLRLRSLPAAEAVEAFASGDVDLVLNGRLVDLPLANTGPLTRGTVRLDAALGQLGLVVRSDEGLLAEPERREALAMAIDRSDLMEPFSLGGWQSATSIVPREMWGDVVPEELEWTDWSMERRRAEARNRIAAYDGAATVSIGMPRGPGSELLFRQLASDFRAIGVEARLVESGSGADLELHDRVARIASPRWFLNQFNCSIRRGPCSPEADAAVLNSLSASNPEEKATLLAQAEIALQDSHVYIPFGAPIRWSLVRGSIVGYQENQWGLHPLFPLAEPPI